MHEARERAEWGRTSSLMALLASCHGNSASPADFNPYAIAAPMPVSMEQFAKANAGVLKSKRADTDRDSIRANQSKSVS